MQSIQNMGDLHYQFYNKYHYIAAHKNSIQIR
jgi:hypothetical protein